MLLHVSIIELFEDIDLVQGGHPLKSWAKLSRAIEDLSKGVVYVGIAIKRYFNGQGFQTGR